jgi:oligopeptide/dipeptide ABC transporter ATP-binding protein
VTEKLTTIEGAPPNLTSELISCPFEPRCRYRLERCAAELPPLLELSPGHFTACWVAQQGGLPHA